MFLNCELIKPILKVPLRPKIKILSCWKYSRLIFSLENLWKLTPQPVFFSRSWYNLVDRMVLPKWTSGQQNIDFAINKNRVLKDTSGDNLAYMNQTSKFKSCLHICKKLLTVILWRSLLFVDNMLTCKLGSCLTGTKIKVYWVSAIMCRLKGNFVIFASCMAFNSLASIVLKEIIII